MERENELNAFSFDECLPAEKTPQGLNKACDERGEIYDEGKRNRKEEREWKRGRRGVGGGRGL